MPLDSEPKWMIGQFNRFSQSIRRVTCDAQRGRNVFESLVVQAVDFDDGFAINLSNACTFFDLDFVHKHGPLVAGIGMVERVGKLVREVSVESPAQAYVEDLASAANPQEGFPVRRGSF